MKKCGYELNVDYLAERTNARRAESSPTGFSFSTDALAEAYEQMGLKVVRSPRGIVLSGECRICGEWSVKNAPSGTRAVHCDSDAHNAYYEALEAKDHA